MPFFEPVLSCVGFMLWVIVTLVDQFIIRPMFGVLAGGSRFLSEILWYSQPAFMCMWVINELEVTCKNVPHVGFSASSLVALPASAHMRGFTWIFIGDQLVNFLMFMKHDICHFHLLLYHIYFSHKDIPLLAIKPNSCGTHAIFTFQSQAHPVHM